MSLFFLVILPNHANAYSGADLLSRVNAVRIENGQSELIENSLLNQAATAKLTDIQSYLYWSHDNPQTGKKWLEFIRENNYAFAAGENLARGFSSVDKIIISWLNSPSHRKNLLSSKFNSVGVAVNKVNYSDGVQDVVVMEFGVSPKTKTNTYISGIFSNLFEQITFYSPVAIL